MSHSPGSNLSRSYRSEARYESARTASREHHRTAAEILRLVFSDYRGNVAVRLWNDDLAVGTDNAPCTLILNQPQPLRDLVLHGDLLQLAEAHLTGEVEVEGNLESLFGLLDYFQERKLSLSERLHLVRLAWTLPRERGGRHGVVTGGGVRRDRNTRETISHHYDVSNDFYRLWLDPEMVYSCAYFSNPEQSVAEAQRDKLDYICRKLRLAPGQRLLDIGCGWGALALWAVRHYGVEAYGITLSEQQYRYACDRAEKEGLAEKVRFELRDYRDLDQNMQYDRIVSVGMFEHIGVASFPGYFGIIERLLAPGGVFLNHGITNDSGWQPSDMHNFINKYIFPDGELTRISTVITAMEDAGFEILDAESLRPHYALTLRRWVQALEARREEAVRLVGEKTYRLWRLYMSGCAYYFDQGNTGIYQVLAGKLHQPWPVPLRRSDLYD
jgi:cyclopropane-fatty-acyl-phospholipid synthase